MEKRLFTSYCAKDMLHDTRFLSIWAELAYRRLYDLLLVAGGELPDNDRDLGHHTRLGTSRWRQVKPLLFEGPDPLLSVEAGVIFCAEILLKIANSSAFSDEQSRKAKLGAEKRKLLKSKKSRSAPVSAGGSAETPAEIQPTANRKPLTDSREESLSASTNPRAKGTAPRQKGMAPDARMLDAAFENFWNAYPRRTAKAAARRAFAAAMNRGATPAQLVAGARAYAGERSGEPSKWTKHPTTWLNGDCWLDVAEDPAQAPPETLETRLGNFYRHWKKTGQWLDDENQLSAVPQAIVDRIDGEFDRDNLESAGQQRLKL